MYLGTSEDVELRKAELLNLVASGKQTDNQIRSAELDIVFAISDYIGGGTWTVVDSKSGVRSVALGNMPHASAFGREVAVAFDIVEEEIGKKDDGTPKVRRYSQITGKSETMYLLLGKLSHPWVREGFGLVYNETTQSYDCSNWYSGFTSNLWAPFVSSVKKVAGDKANNGVLKEKAVELLQVLKLLTVDKEEQSGNNIQDMEKRVEDFKAALVGSSFADVKLDYTILANAPNKFLTLRDAFNEFAERKAKTKAKAPSVESEEMKEIRSELGISGDTPVVDVITDMKADAQKYNEISTQFALSFDANAVNDADIDEAVKRLEVSKKDLKSQIEEVENQIKMLKVRKASAGKIAKLVADLVKMKFTQEVAEMMVRQNIGMVEGMVKSNGSANGQSSSDADSEATK